jgi:hypothetical protein
LRRALASAPALLVAIAFLTSGCAWLGLGGNAAPPLPEISSDKEVQSLPTTTEPGRLFLIYKDGDFTAPDLAVPAGPYEIEVFNFNNPRPIGFFLRVPDRYGRELEHLATGGGIEMGEGKVFPARLVAGSTYFYNCPVTQSSNHLITAVAVPLEGEPVGAPAPPDGVAGPEEEATTPAAGESTASEAGLELRLNEQPGGNPETAADDDDGGVKLEASGAVEDRRR